MLQKGAGDIFRNAHVMLSRHWQEDMNDWPDKHDLSYIVKVLLFNEKIL